jgi:hypothetical protein
MTTTITIKQGETLIEPFLMTLDVGNWACTAQVRSATDVLIADLTTTLNAFGSPDSAGNTHSGVLSADSTQTPLWPVGNWLFDIKFFDESTPPVVLIDGPYILQVTQPKTHG